MSEVEVYQSRDAMLQPATDGWTSVVSDVSQLANMISGTEFVPASLRGSSAKTAAAMLTGRELGLAPMTALSSIHVINGKPGISAEMMRALVLQAGHSIAVTTSTSQRVVIKGRRAGDDEWTTVEWTDQDARRAGLQGGNYAKYPRQMLAARATTELCRLVFADVIHGLRSLEELESMGEDEAPTVVQVEQGGQQPAGRTVGRRRAKVQAIDASPSEQGEQPGQQAEPEQPAASGRRSPGLTRRGGQQAPQEPEQEEQRAPELVPDEPPADEPERSSQPPQERRPDPMTGSQNRMLHAILGQYQVGEDERHEVLTLLVGRLVTTASDLTKGEAKRALDMLNACEDAAEFRQRLEQLDRGA